MASTWRCQLPVSSYFFHGKLVFTVAVSTTDRQAYRLAAFLQAKDRPMFKGLTSDSTAHNHNYMPRMSNCMVVASLVAASELPDCAAETTRWSWMGELCAMTLPRWNIFDTATWPNKNNNKYLHPLLLQVTNYNLNWIRYSLKETRSSADADKPARRI